MPPSIATSRDHPRPGPGDSAVTSRLALRRHRRVAKRAACVLGAAGFIALYALSWVLVLEL